MERGRARRSEYPLVDDQKTAPASTAAEEREQPMKSCKALNLSDGINLSLDPKKIPVPVCLC
jgi:hypothetical protein